MIRIIIADDHAVMRAGLRELLGQRGSIQVVAEADNGHDAVALAESVAADILLLDVAMPGPPFLDTLQRVREVAPRLRVLVLTMYPEDQFAALALRGGASGYLTKSRTPDELLHAVTRIARGGRYISEALAERLANELEGDFGAVPHEQLSDREMEVLLLLGRGHSVKEAAGSLQLSMKTVSTFRTRLMKKMGFATNADIVQYVARIGMIPPT